MNLAVEKSLVAAVLATVLGALAAGWVLSGDPTADLSWLGYPGCGFKAALGVPCPLCGGYSAFAAGFRGDFATAWRENPFSLLFLATLVALVPALIVALVRPGSIGPFLKSKGFIWSSIIWGGLLLLVLVLFWIARLL